MSQDPSFAPSPDELGERLAREILDGSFGLADGEIDDLVSGLDEDLQPLAEEWIEIYLGWGAVQEAAERFGAAFAGELAAAVTVAAGHAAPEKGADRILRAWFEQLDAAREQAGEDLVEPGLYAAMTFLTLDSRSPGFQKEEAGETEPVLARALAEALERARPSFERLLAGED